MATFLFWNIARKPLRAEVARLTQRHNVDVLMLAECALTPRQILSSLREGGATWEFAAPINPTQTAKIQLYTRGANNEVREASSSLHCTIRELNPPDLPSVLLAIVHLPSKLHADADSQFAECVELGRQLRQAEEIARHRRLLVVGDFNVNPFEPGMLAANALNCESSRRLAAKGARKVGDVSYPFFYNPMWNFFGDAGAGPGGTYFYQSSRWTRVSWNIFDQVLVRSALLPYFQTSQVEILTGDGQQSFLTEAGTPTKRGASDHLPLLFKLNS